MKRSTIMVPLAALLLAACGGGGDEGSKTDVQGSPDTAGAVGTTTGTSTGLSTGQPVDTAGMGTNPPAAGGQGVDTAGAADTAQGTPTAP
ncbi:hypothetical protein [Longimicrobium sp.]|jgi:hypothetical protein|uniref:hypothetical protein n=1 Tax=Longimicrobium sp. TaxID=2029185 RepID=UPI002EDA627E